MVDKISETIRSQIEGISPMYMPDSPTQAGLTAKEIKERLSQFVIGKEEKTPYYHRKTIYSEINRIVDEVNGEFGNSFIDLNVEGTLKDLNNIPKESGYIQELDTSVIANSKLPQGKYGFFQLCKGDIVRQFALGEDAVLFRVYNATESQSQDILWNSTSQPIIEIKENIIIDRAVTLSQEDVDKIFAQPSPKIVGIVDSGNVKFRVELEMFDVKYSPQDKPITAFFSNLMFLDDMKYYGTLRVDYDTREAVMYREEEQRLPKPTREDLGKALEVNNRGEFDIGEHKVAHLGADGKLLENERPPEKSEYEEFATFSDFPEQGQSDIIYVDKSTNYSYRWSGTQYVQLKGDLILGEVGGTAYEGSKGKANEIAIKNVWKYDFNQLFDTASSTLPTANGLTITNIYGGHHVNGTTDRQYYHKMYALATKVGHWYYFTPNFSDGKSVYILGHIDGTSFSTKSGKVFQGGDKFDIYIQIEKDKTLDFDVQPILVDLTEMFGDGNEPTTIEEVYNYINANTYYPFTDVVKVTPQTLTEEQQRQAKINIGSYKDFKYNFEQLVNNNNLGVYNQNGISTIISNGTANYKGTSTSDFTRALCSYKLDKTHKYYINLILKGNTNNKYITIYDRDYAVIGYSETPVIFTNYEYMQAVFSFRIGDVLDFTISPILIDLTEMFGAGNEPTSVEEVQQYLVKDKYYPYGINIEPSMYVTKGEVNSINCVYSNTIDINTIPSPNTWDEGVYRYKNNITGLLAITLTTKDKQPYEAEIFIRDKDDIKYGTTLTGQGTSTKQQIVTIPISKGDLIVLQFGNLQTRNRIDFWKTRIIHSKEI